MKVIIDGVEYVPKKQIKSLLADAKVGDLVNLETGKWHTIKTIIQQHESCLDFLVYGLDNGRYYAPNGNGMRTDNPIMVEWQPIAPEGTAEWAWQMWCLLGKMVVLKGYKASAKDSWGVCPQTSLFRGNDANYWRKYKGEWLRTASAYQWQLYEPEPFAKVKVGDYLELSNGKPVKVANVATIANQYDMVIDTLDGKFLGYYWFSGKPICRANSPITRILKPSEVVVTIGCLSGTVEKASDFDMFLLWHSKKDCDYSMIRFDALDPATAYLVRDLIAKQEEEE
jgi:hypothetical protein